MRLDSLSRGGNVVDPRAGARPMDIGIVDGRIAVCTQITGENVRMLIAAALKAGIVIK